MALLLRVADWLSALVRGCGAVAVWLALALVAVICLDVVTRKLQTPIPVLDSTRLQELEWHLHAVLFLLCMGYGVLMNAHVRIDVAVGGMHPRKRAWIELLGCVLLAVPFCAVIIYIGTDYWHQSFVQNEASDAATGLPYRWIVKGFIPIGVAVLLAATISHMLRLIVFLFGPPHLRGRVPIKL